MTIQGLFVLTHEVGSDYCNSCFNKYRNLHVILHHLDPQKKRLCNECNERTESFDKWINRFSNQDIMSQLVK